MKTKTRKNTKSVFTKIITLFVLAVFIVGLLPAAFAKEGKEDEQNKGLGLGVIANSAAEVEIVEATAGSDASLETAVTAEVAAETTTEVEAKSEFEKRVDFCVERVMKNHPDASKERVEKFCRKHLAVKIKIAEATKDINEKVDEKEAELKQLKLERRDKIVAMHKEFKAKLNEKEAKIYAHLNAKVKQWCLDNPEECRNRIAYWKLEVPKEKRKVAQEKAEQARERYLEAMQKFEDAEQKYSEEKQTFLELKAELKACTTDNPSEKCKELQQKALEHAKKMVTHSIRMLTNHLNKIKERVNENENFSDEEASKITTEIEAQLKLLVDLQARVDAAQTKEELKKVAKEVQELWRNYKQRARLHALHVANARIRGVVEKSEKVETKFQCALDALAAQDKDVSAIDTVVAQYNEKLAAAQQHYTEARAEFKAALELRTSGDLTEAEIQAVIKHNEDGKRHLELARESVKQTQELFKEIVRMIKEAGGDVGACSAKVEAETEQNVEVVAENNTAVEETVSVETITSVSAVGD